MQMSVTSDMNTTVLALKVMGVIGLITAFFIWFEPSNALFYLEFYVILFFLPTLVVAVSIDLFVKESPKRRRMK